MVTPLFDQIEELVSPKVVGPFRKGAENTDNHLTDLLSTRLKAMPPTMLQFGRQGDSIPIKRVYDRTSSEDIKSVLLDLAVHEDESDRLLASEHRIKIVLEQNEYQRRFVTERSGCEKMPADCPICHFSRTVTSRRVNCPSRQIDVSIFWSNKHSFDDDLGYYAPISHRLNLAHPFYLQTHRHPHYWSMSHLSVVPLMERCLWKTFLSWKKGFELAKKSGSRVRLMPPDDFFFPIARWVDDSNFDLFVMRTAFYILGSPPGLEDCCTFQQLKKRLGWISNSPYFRQIAHNSVYLDRVAINSAYKDIFVGRVFHVEFEVARVPERKLGRDGRIIAGDSSFETVWSVYSIECTE
jgi:hypothetical protein